MNATPSQWQSITRMIIGLAAITGIGSRSADAQVVSYAGGFYAQTFNALPASGSASWSNGLSPLPGWYAFAGVAGANATRDPTTTPFTAIAADAGGGTTGRLNSYGNDPDRALGSIASNSLGDCVYAVVLQ